MKTILIIIVIIILCSLLAFLLIIWIKKLAKENTHFTTIGNEQGKLIAQEDDIVDVLSNMKGVYYDKMGELHREKNPKTYGSLFKELGTIVFGLSPIRKVYRFSLSWNEFVEREAKEVRGNKYTYEIIHKNEKIDSFRRFYSHAIPIFRIEMKDGSKVDMVFIVTFEILNIIQVIFKIKPEGIILTQAEVAFSAAIQDEMKKFDYQKFRDEVNKSDQDSDFVKEVITKTNAIIEKKFHLRADLIEMKVFDLSKGEPGDEEILKATKEETIQKLLGDAKITKALKEARARKIQGGGMKEYFEEVAKIIGKKNIAAYANLEQVKDTGLLSYGSGSVTPIVAATITKKKEVSDD